MFSVLKYPIASKPEHPGPFLPRMKQNELQIAFISAVDPEGGYFKPKLNKQL